MNEILRHTAQTDWITTVFLGCLLMLALAKSVDRVRFSEFVQLAVTNKYFHLQGKEVNSFSKFNILLLVFQVLSYALFLYFVGRAFFSEMTDMPYAFPLILAGYTGFTFLKYSLEKVVGYLFFIEKKIALYTYQKTGYRCWLAGVVLLFNALLAYTWPDSKLLLWGGVGFVLLANALFLYELFRREAKTITQNWFYFILYLCTLEISPYIILYKVVV